MSWSPVSHRGRPPTNEKKEGAKKVLRRRAGGPHQVRAALARAGRQRAPGRRLPPQRGDLRLSPQELRPQERHSLGLVLGGAGGEPRRPGDGGPGLLRAEVGENLRERERRGRERRAEGGCSGGVSRRSRLRLQLPTFVVSSRTASVSCRAVRSAETSCSGRSAKGW